MPSMLDYFPWGGQRNERNSSDVERGHVQMNRTSTLDHPLQDLMDIDSPAGAGRMQSEGMEERSTSVIPLELKNTREEHSGLSM